MPDTEEEVSRMSWSSLVGSCKKLANQVRNAEIGPAVTEEAVIQRLGRHLESLKFGAQVSDVQKHDRHFQGKKDGRCEEGIGEQWLFVAHEEQYLRRGRLK